MSKVDNSQTKVVQEILAKRGTFCWRPWQDPNHMTYVYGPKVDWFVYKKEQQTKAPLFCIFCNFEPSGKTVSALNTELETHHAHPRMRGYSEIHFSIAADSIIYEQLSKAGVFDTYRPDFPNRYD